jgi:putative PIN family toxin of toxin-antitoxin system
VGKIKKVVIDTNVFISGFGWDGKPEIVLTLLQEHRIQNYISDAIYEELKKVVSYPKLKFSGTLQNKILEFVFFYSEFVEPAKHLSIVTKDPADNIFIECAIDANTEFIISGDQHLLSLRKYKTLKIVDVVEFLELSF